MKASLHFLMIQRITMASTRIPSLVALLLFLLTNLQWSDAQPAPKRINCGGGQYRDSEGNIWLPDVYYKGGKTYTNDNVGISGSRDDELLQTERYASGETLTYDIPVTPGVYKVIMQFAENYSRRQDVGKRIFHVFVEGILAFQDFDIYKEAGKRGNRLVEESFEVHAVGGSITIDFIPVKGNAKINTIQIQSTSTKGPHPDIRAVVPVEGEPRPLGIRWADSYSVGDKCYCDKVTTYDHGVGDIVVETPIGWMTVRQACEILGAGPGVGENPLYNDVQCGNGPPNDQSDEQKCPGRVDLGRDGCGHIGPRWNFDALVSEQGDEVDSTLPVQPPRPKPSKKDRFVLSAGGGDDDGSLVENAEKSWKYYAGGDYPIRRKANRVPKFFFRSHRSAPEKLTYKIDGFNKNMLYRVSLGFAEIWSANCENGARLMSVRINDRAYRNYSNKSSALDVYKEAGCNTSLVLSYVQKPDRNGSFEIVIGAKPDGVKDSNAMISFIEITRA